MILFVVSFVITITVIVTTKQYDKPRFAINGLCNCSNQRGLGRGGGGQRYSRHSKYLKIISPLSRADNDKDDFDESDKKDSASLRN